MPLQILLFVNKWILSYDMKNIISCRKKLDILLIWYLNVIIVILCLVVVWIASTYLQFCHNLL